MGKLSGEFREPNRKDKVTRFPSVSYARQLGLLVNTLGNHLKPMENMKSRGTKTNSIGASEGEVLKDATIPFQSFGDMRK